MTKGTIKLVDHDRVKERVKVMKAMAHPSRLVIIDELAHGERCVRDLQELVGHDMSTVSKHLAVLKTAGIVKDESLGKQIFYVLNVPCILNFFHCIESAVTANKK